MNRILLSGAAALTLQIVGGGIIISVSAQEKAPAEVVILNAKVWTVDPARPTAEAIALNGQFITAVGTTKEPAGILKNAAMDMVFHSIPAESEEQLIRDVKAALHAQHVRPEDFADFHRLGVIASVQPLVGGKVVYSAGAK